MPDGTMCNTNQKIPQFSAWGKSRAMSHDKKTMPDTNVSTQSLCATDVSQLETRPSSALHPRHGLEDLLWDQTQAVATPNIDFSSFANLSLEQWEPRSHSRSDHEGFHTYVRRHTTVNTRTASEVLVTGQLQCSVAQAMKLLRCPGEPEFNATMSDMYGRSFQKGSVVHSFTSGKVDTHDVLSEARHRCIKTADFARPRLALLGDDERWCFLEDFAPLAKCSDDTQTGFMLSQRTLQPASLPSKVRPPIELVRRRGGKGFKRSKKRTHQLSGLSVGYFVEAISGSHPAAVRLVFYACCFNEDRGVTKRRMEALARGVSKLPAIVRCRQRSVHAPIDPWSLSRLVSKFPSAPASSQCISCSRTLHSLLMVKKTRCYLCAHFVCSRCWIRQPLKTANGRSVSVLVCTHCVHSVESCNHDHFAASALSERWSDSSASTSSPTFDASPAFQHSQVVQLESPVEACTVSHAVAPAYSSGGGVAVGSAKSIVVQYQHCLAKELDDLALICQLDTREMNCVSSLVTIVASILQDVLATNFALFGSADLAQRNDLIMLRRYLLTSRHGGISSEQRFMSLPLRAVNSARFSLFHKGQQLVMSSLLIVLTTGSDTKPIKLLVSKSDNYREVAAIRSPHSPSLLCPRYDDALSYEKSTRLSTRQHLLA